VFLAASLPMILFVLAQSRKWFVYLYGEYFIFAFGITLLAAAALFALSQLRLSDVRAHTSVLATCAGFVLLIGASIIPYRSLTATADWKLGPRHLERDLARAAAKAEIGDGKLVGGRIGLWYVSGGTRWYDISSDLLDHDNTKLDLPRYFSRFDYIVDHEFMADTASINTPRAAVSTWYGEDVLRFAGFYMGSDPTISYTRFAPHAVEKVMGHVYRNGRLLRFTQDDGGTSGNRARRKPRLRREGDVPRQSNGALSGTDPAVGRSRANSHGF
jgi:hypothetical protein